jgi:hypothetical protein
MEESKGALLRIAIPLIAFKVWFAILLLTYAPTRDTMVWIAATHWPLVFIVALLVGPGIAGYRLLRARAHRDRMRRAEFMVSSSTPKAPQERVGKDDAQCSALWEMVSRLERGD